MRASISYSAWVSIPLPCTPPTQGAVAHHQTTVGHPSHRTHRDQVVTPTIIHRGILTSTNPVTPSKDAEQPAYVDPGANLGSAATGGRLLRQPPRRRRCPPGRAVPAAGPDVPETLGTPLLPGRQTEAPLRVEVRSTVQPSPRNAGPTRALVFGACPGATQTKPNRIRRCRRRSHCLAADRWRCSLSTFSASMDVWYFFRSFHLCA